MRRGRDTAGPKPPMEVEVICRQCGEAISGRRDKRYCSPRCKDTARRRRNGVAPGAKRSARRRKCAVCGVRFRVIKGRRETCCSRECGIALSKTRLEDMNRTRSRRQAQRPPCAVCGRTVTAGRSRYCTLICQNRARTKRNSELQSTTRTCRVCASEFSLEGIKGRPPVYCSDRCRGYKQAYAKRRKSAHCLWCGSSYRPDSSSHRHCSAACEWTDALMKRAHDKREVARAWRVWFPECSGCQSVFCAQGPQAKYCRRCRGSRRGGWRDRRAKVAGRSVVPRLVFERDGWRCQICGASTPERWRGTKHRRAPELDHRVPLSVGGEHSYDNTQTACRECNAKKGNRNRRGQLPLIKVAHLGPKVPARNPLF